MAEAQEEALAQERKPVEALEVLGEIIAKCCLGPALQGQRKQPRRGQLQPVESQSPTQTETTVPLVEKLRLESGFWLVVVLPDCKGPQREELLPQIPLDPTRLVLVALE